MQGFQLDVPFTLAVAAGFLSFLSPCVLPLAPAYIGYLSGQVATAEGPTPPRRTTFLHGIFFVLGFSAIFVALGAAASGIGQLLYAHRGLLGKLGGVIIIVFGLHTLGFLKIPFLNYDTRRHRQPRPELGYASSALMGFFFGAGWSPCVGAVLGAILTLAINEATVERGALRSAGLTRSVRGARGGYTLTRPPGQINLREIYHVFIGIGSLEPNDKPFPRKP